MWYYFVINVDVFYFMTLEARRVWCTGQVLCTFSITLRFLRQNIWKCGLFLLSSVKEGLVLGLSSYKLHIFSFLNNAI
jgi:hypothetical protein